MLAFGLVPAVANSVRSVSDVELDATRRSALRSPRTDCGRLVLPQD